MPNQLRKKSVVCDHCGGKFAPQGYAAHIRFLKKKQSENGNHVAAPIHAEMVELKPMVDRIADALDNYDSALQELSVLTDNLKKGRTEMQMIQRTLSGN